MAWLQYLRVFAIAILVPEILCATFWLVEADAVIVRILFVVSAIGIFITLMCVVLFGFIEVFGRVSYRKLSELVGHFSIIYVWSTIFPVLISFFVLYFVGNLRNSAQIENAIDVLWIITLSSLLFHAGSAFFKIILDLNKS